MNITNGRISDQKDEIVYGQISKDEQRMCSGNGMPVTKKELFALERNL